MFTEGINAYVADIEANNLYPYQTQTWTIRIKRVGADDWLRLNPFRMSKEEVKKQILDFIFREPNPIIIGHNALGFDMWVLWKDFGLDISVGPDKICGRAVTFFDTLFASQFFLPDREGYRPHSLKSWGERLGDHKLDYRQIALDLGIISEEENEFCRWSAQMDEYCEKDCIICEQIYIILDEQLAREQSQLAFRLGQKNFYLMNAQAFTGIKFDQEKAVTLQARIEAMIQEVRDEVEPQLPPRPLKESEKSEFKMPAKPFIKDGSYSASLNNFIEKHKAVILPGGKQMKVYDRVLDIVPNFIVRDDMPMLLDDQNALKDYFLGLGWEPTLWNVKKVNGKPVRDDKGKLIQTSPKLQENGVICENLLELDGELPKKIVRFMSLRNRNSILTGWLENDRLKWDGRLSAGSSGIAATHRQKHNTVVNIPKAQDDVLLGKEFRSLFTVEPGNKLVGCDQAALEARCEAHWIFEFDPVNAQELINGDIHRKNAKAFYPEETKDYDIDSPDFNKDDPGFKPYRSKSKNGKYAVTYGASAGKLAKTLGKPEKHGKVLFDQFWKVNKGLKEFKDRLEYFWEKEGNKKWISAIDGRRLHSRSKHSLVNLCFQSTGAIIVDYALCLFDKKMGGLILDDKGRPYYQYKGKPVKRVQYMHDEFGSETDETIAEEIAKIEEEVMVEAGVRLKLNVPLVGEAKIGMNWAETH